MGEKMPSRTVFSSRLCLKISGLNEVGSVRKKAVKWGDVFMTPGVTARVIRASMNLQRQKLRDGCTPISAEPHDLTLHFYVRRVARLTCAESGSLTCVLDSGGCQIAPLGEANSGLSTQAERRAVGVVRLARLD
jgi:hypothetical protein